MYAIRSYYVSGVGHADQVAVTTRPVRTTESGVRKPDIGSERNDAQSQECRNDEQHAIEMHGVLTRNDPPGARQTAASGR